MPNNPSIQTTSYCDGAIKEARQSWSCYDPDNHVSGSSVPSSQCSGFKQPDIVVTQLPCTNIGVTYPAITGSRSTSVNFAVEYFQGLLTTTEVRARGLKMCEAEAAKYGATWNSTPACIVNRYWKNTSTGQTAIQAGIEATSDVPPSGSEWVRTHLGSDAIGYRTHQIDQSSLTTPKNWSCEVSTSSPYWRRICG